MSERIQFVNAPVQNGAFDFDDSPHKLVGMRLADALNKVAERPASPHLWNLVRLTGDNEYANSGCGLSREEFEFRRIKDRYDRSSTMATPDIDPSYRTDIDSDVAQAALELVESGLSAGKLSIEEVTLDVCIDCGNSLGKAKHCNGCGSDRTGHERKKVLHSIRDEADQIFTREDTYGSIKTSYIDAMARHNPVKLPISKTRQAGISLSDFSLEGQVLDPRTGLHVTALVAGEKIEADTIVMMTTASVAIKALAFGVHFRKLSGTELKFGLYGRIPYADMAAQDSGELDPAEEEQFRNWYLPLMSLTSREAISVDQVEAYRKCFKKICHKEPSDIDVKTQVESGKLRWITDRNSIASVRPAVD